MAQGAAMAIEDAAVLANCLEPTCRCPTRWPGTRQPACRAPAASRPGSRRNATVFHLSGIQAWLRNRAVGRARGQIMDWLYRYDPLSDRPAGPALPAGR